MSANQYSRSAYPQNRYVPLGGDFAIVDRKVSRDEHRRHSARQLPRIVEGGVLANGVGIENCEVSYLAMRDDAPILQPESFRRLTRHLSYSFFKSDQPFFTDILAQYTDKSSK